MTRGGHILFLLLFFLTSLCNLFFFFNRKEIAQLGGEKLVQFETFKLALSKRHLTYAR